AKVDMLEQLKFIQENWSILRKAPWTYLAALFICVSVCCLAAYGLLEQFKYAPLRDTLNTQKERLDKKEDEIKLLQRQFDQKKSEMDATEKERDRYRNMVLLSPEKNTLYTQLTNEELRVRALNLVLQMRQAFNEFKAGMDELRHKQYEDMSKAENDDKKLEIFYRDIKLTSKLWNDFFAEYDKKYKSEAILVRNELRLRLPEGIELKSTDPSYSESFYEHPYNTFGYEIVINRLERMALSLPK